MMKVYLTVLFLAAAVFAESVRETETWMPSDDVDLESSGDFGFTLEGDKIDDDDYDDDVDGYEDGFDDMSGSGDEDIPEDKSATFTTELDNNIPDKEPAQPQPTEDEFKIVQRNEIARSSSVQQSFFNKTELLAAVIAGGAVGLLFAVLLILLLVYRMKKKDEGSYDLGKKPIYKKAPTTEIYA